MPTLARTPVPSFATNSGRFHSSGIGFTTVQHLARRGAKVYIGARSEAKAKAAIERLRTEGLQPGNGELDWFEFDLSDPRKAKKSAENFLAKEKRLDVLGACESFLIQPLSRTHGIPCV